MTSHGLQPDELPQASACGDKLRKTKRALAGDYALHQYLHSLCLVYKKPRAISGLIGAKDRSMESHKGKCLEKGHLYRYDKWISGTLPFSNFPGRRSNLKQSDAVKKR